MNNLRRIIYGGVAMGLIICMTGCGSTDTKTMVVDSQPSGVAGATPETADVDEPDVTIPEDAKDLLKKSVNGDIKDKPVVAATMRVTNDRTGSVAMPDGEGDGKSHYALRAACVGTGSVKLEAGVRFGDKSKTPEWSSRLVCEPEDAITSTYLIPRDVTYLKMISGSHADASMMFRLDKADTVEE